MSSNECDGEPSERGDRSPLGVVTYHPSVAGDPASLRGPPSQVRVFDAPPLTVPAPQLVDARGIGGVLGRGRGHDQRVLVVVRVVALADAEPLEAVLLVERLGRD